MPVMGGIPDTPVPIADIDLLPHSGETPKEPWINPAGAKWGASPRADRPGDLCASPCRGCCARWR